MSDSNPEDDGENPSTGAIINEKFNYVIGKKDLNSGIIDIYSIHGISRFFGDINEAKRVFNSLTSKNMHDYYKAKIYKLVEIDTPNKKEI